MINYTSTLLLGLSEEMGDKSFYAPAKWAFWQAGLPWGLEESRVALSSMLGVPGAAAQLSKRPWAPDCARGQRKHLTKSQQQTQTGARAAPPWGALAGLPAPCSGVRLQGASRSLPHQDGAGKDPTLGVSRPQAPSSALVHFQIVTEEAQNPFD